ncbi:acetyl-CoA synthetase [Peribacillus deserti]|uniref:acetate--CoA ligase n=1 Tax=Peribacillus deserti TaxID=673318 RepID=A0ABS2QDV7_9BACI|nr:AMP-binding protein [Peribacillus deserti]MBM7691351.1 acetyl-CoA synthetase [Peribacillus deserti]
MSQSPVWFPSEEFKKSTRMYKWMEKLGFEDYDAFFLQSIDDIAWFWEEAVKELEIKWYKPYKKTLDLSSGLKYPKWFMNGKMNIVHNAVEKWAADSSMRSQVAIIWEGDNGEIKKYTFEELSKEIDIIAAGLAAKGIQPGDVVTLYMPMIPETVIAMFAIAKIGAIFSPAFSGYGAEAVATRINAAGAKVLITADGFYRRGKVISMKEEADRAVHLSPSIEKVIVVKRTDANVPWNSDKDVDWSELKQPSASIKTRETDADEPVMLIYTSGTTGKPKGAVHNHSGFPIKAAFDAGVCMDVCKGDTLFWVTDMGWMMGPFLVFGGLVNGASIVMFEGTPDFPNPDRIWDLVDKHNVTHLGISPTLIRSLMRHGTEWIDKHDLSSLKAIGSTGEPWNPEPWMWLFDNVCKKKVPIINYSGGTEISGGILGNVLLKPISPITFNSPIPGMDVHVYDSEQNSVLNEVGELVILQPWVGMTNGFWKENERYEQTYWSRWGDTWVHGDWVIQDSDGFWTITGRSDDILNVAGKRLGPAELESALVEHPLVMEAAAIGIPDEVKGESAICFAVLNTSAYDSAELKQELLKLVGKHLGKALLPKEIYFVDELPKTRNGKVMRRVIRAAYLNQNAGDITSLENPAILEAIKNMNITK